MLSGSHPTDSEMSTPLFVWFSVHANQYVKAIRTSFPSVSRVVLSKSVLGSGSGYDQIRCNMNYDFIV